MGFCSDGLAMTQCNGNFAATRERVASYHFFGLSAPERKGCIRDRRGASGCHTTLEFGGVDTPHHRIAVHQHHLI